MIKCIKFDIIRLGGFMKKKFYKLSMTLIIASSLLSVLFAFLYYLASEVIVPGQAMLIFLFYVKKAFDLFAVFIGYGTIIYAFSRYSAIDGLRLTGYFSISVLISFAYQVLGTCFFESNFAVDFIITTIYYSFGDCFITQYVPALIIAFVAFKSTKDGTRRIEKFVSWSNPTQRVMMKVTFVIFIINFACLLIFDILAFLIEAEWMIYANELGSIFLSILEVAIIYIVIQYTVYMLVHHIYTKYTDLGATVKDEADITKI